MKPEEQLQASVQTTQGPSDVVRDSSCVRWHAKNGLVLWLTSFVAVLLLQFVWLWGQYLGCLGMVGVVVVSVVAISKALKGERWRIPLVSDLAEKF